MNTALTMRERGLAAPMAVAPLEQIPEVLDQGEDGTGVWHENAEMVRLTRPMTDLEAQDHASYDRSLYRMRRASLDRLRRLYGDVWMLVPKRENRGRAWVPDRILKAVA